MLSTISRCDACDGQNLAGFSLKTNIKVIPPWVVDVICSHLDIPGAIGQAPSARSVAENLHSKACAALNPLTHKRNWSNLDHLARFVNTVVIQMDCFSPFSCAPLTQCCLAISDRALRILYQTNIASSNPFTYAYADPEQSVLIYREDKENNRLISLNAENCQSRIAAVEIPQSGQAVSKLNPPIYSSIENASIILQDHCVVQGPSIYYCILELSDMYQVEIVLNGGSQRGHQSVCTVNAKLSLGDLKLVGEKQLSDHNKAILEAIIGCLLEENMTLPCGSGVMHIPESDVEYLEAELEVLEELLKHPNQSLISWVVDHSDFSISEQQVDMLEKEGKITMEDQDLILDDKNAFTCLIESKRQKLVDRITAEPPPKTKPTHPPTYTKKNKGSKKPCPSRQTEQSHRPSTQLSSKEQDIIRAVSRGERVKNTKLTSFLVNAIARRSSEDLKEKTSGSHKSVRFQLSESTKSGKTFVKIHGKKDLQVSTYRAKSMVSTIFQAIGCTPQQLEGLGL